MRNRGMSVRPYVLPFLGMAMLLGTLGWGVKLGAFPGWLLGMGACAIALLLAGIVWQERGSLRDTLASLVYCAFVILAVVFAYLIAANNSQRIDLTRAAIHTLSEQTISFLETLETPIRVTAFAEPRDHAQLRRFFDLYEARTDKLSFEIYNPESDIAVARRFEANVYPGDTFAVAHDGGVETRRERFTLSMRNQYRESVLTNALLKIDRGGGQSVYFLSGHRERPLAKPEGERRDPSIQVFADLVGQRLMPTRSLILRQQARVPEDAAVVVIAGPAVDLFDPEREMLIDYLDEGGALFVLFDPTFDAQDLDNLKAVLAHAGIGAPNSVLIDKYGDRDFRNILADRGSDHPVVATAGDLLLKLFLAREFELAPELATGATRRVEPLLVSKSSVWREDPMSFLRRGRPQEPADREEIHERIVAVASSWPTAGGTRRGAARVIVVGDADFLANENLLAKDPLVFSLHALNWLAQRDDLLAIPPKLVAPSAFVMTQKRFWLLVGCLLAIGLGILAGGVSATVARRRMG